MEIIFKRLTPKISLIFISIFFILTLLFFSQNISSPGLQYDETLFINGALGFKFEWFKHGSFFGLPVYVFPYIGALKSWIYFPIFKVFEINATSIRIPSLIIGVFALYIPLYINRNNLSLFKLFVYLSIFLSCSNFYMLSRNDWGPVSLNLLISSCLYSLLLFQIDFSKRKKSFLIFLLSFLIIFNKLDGIVVILSIITINSVDFLLKAIPNLHKREFEEFKNNANTFFSKLFLFMPSLFLFLFRYLGIKKTVNNLALLEGKKSFLTFLVDSIRTLLDPFTLDQYFYGISQEQIPIHYILYLFLLSFSFIAYLTIRFVSQNIKIQNFTNNGVKLCCIGFLNIVFLYIIPMKTSIHHYHMAVFPILWGTALNFAEISDFLFYKKFRVVFFSALIIFSLNLALNVNGSFFHWKQLNDRSYSKIWNNEIYDIANNYSDILSNENIYVSSILTGWGYLNQIESLNAKKINEFNYDSKERFRKLNRKDVEIAYEKYLQKYDHNQLKRDHFLIFSGPNKPLELSEIQYSDINFRNKKVAVKDIYTKKDCLEIYPKEIFDIETKNGEKYHYEQISKVMKFSHSCVFKLNH